MAWSLRASSYAHAIPLITITALSQTSKRKTNGFKKPKKQGYRGKRSTNIKNTFSWASAGLTLKTRLE